MYNKETGEYEYGKNYRRDGSNWPSSVKTPKLSDAYRVLRNTGATEFIMTITGKLYKGRSKISVVSQIVDLDSIREVLTPLKQGSAKHGGGGYRTEVKIQQLMGLIDEPQKISFMSFFPLD